MNTNIKNTEMKKVKRVNNPEGRTKEFGVKTTRVLVSIPPWKKEEFKRHMRELKNVWLEEYKESQKLINELKAIKEHFKY